ncbi:MAG: patatin-like phospholipase family protein [Myxococcota bacterium]
MDPSERYGLGGKLGLALGSGAARGWAHVGALRELEVRGIRPGIVAGSSAGAIVGAFWAADQLEELEQWGRTLDRRAVVGLLDLSLRGGLIRAQRLFDVFQRLLGHLRIEDLPRDFAAVATDIDTGREIWIREGPLLNAVRASVAVPGLVTPFHYQGRWLVDGGLVNAVPVSLCRAMGAHSVIAVDVNTTLVGRRTDGPRSAVRPPPPPRSTSDHEVSEDVEAVARTLGVAERMDGWRAALAGMLGDLRERAASGERHEPDDRPSIYEVMVCSLNVMQARITRSRMAGDPPELLVAPRLADFALLDFDRVPEAIEEGRRAVTQALASAARAQPEVGPGI